MNYWNAGLFTPVLIPDGTECYACEQKCVLGSLKVSDTYYVLDHYRNDNSHEQSTEIFQLKRWFNISGWYYETCSS